MKFVIAIAFVVGAVFVSACSQSPTENAQTVRPGTPSAVATPMATATPDELAFARANYAKHCANCHGAEGDGGLATVEDKKIKVPSLKVGHALKHTDDDFVDQINNGEEEMPAFRDKLSPDEINQLVRFIRTEFQGK